jgi:FtsP/CotA-like multicopper oxidase with cupredoxin domain
MSLKTSTWTAFRIWLLQALWQQEKPLLPASNLRPLSADPTAFEVGDRTAVSRSYDFVLERSVQKIDGFERDVILVNNEFPGPLVEANFGDTISVTVHNNISGPDEGTSLHWHGMLQTGTPWFDGVTGVSQCPIAPGDTFTYTFLADQYGTSCRRIWSSNETAS